MKNNKKGISLVALIITIIVLIILTGAVVITMTQGNIIEKSKEAVFKSNVKIFQEELRNNILDEQVAKMGTFDRSSINAIFGGEGNKDITHWIKSYTDEYGDKFEIIEGELACIEANLTAEEKAWLCELGLIAYKDAETYNAYAEGLGYTVLTHNKYDEILHELGDKDYSGIPEKLALPYGITDVSMRQFIGCENFTDVIIPNTVTMISMESFMTCKNLKKIIIPSTVITIEDTAFYWCTNLSSVTIPSSVTTIDSYAFSNCTSLNTINFDPNFKGTIDILAFENTPWLTNQLGTGVTSGTVTINGIDYNLKINSIY